MSVKTTTHLNFRGEAREALNFYHSVFGGDERIVTYADFGVSDPTHSGQVMWGEVVSPHGFRIMAFDVPPQTVWNAGERAFYVSVRGNAEREVADYWQKLSEGSTVVQPLGPAAWSPLYGMLKDRFGITWVIDVITENASG